MVIKNTKPNWVEDDIMAENSLKQNKEYQIKLSLLRELNSDIIALGKSQITKTWIYDWIDKQKEKLQISIK